MKKLNYTDFHSPISDVIYLIPTTKHKWDVIKDFVPLSLFSHGAQWPNAAYVGLLHDIHSSEENRLLLKLRGIEMDEFTLDKETTFFRPLDRKEYESLHI